jgi:sugar lactone lactonase YvrE
MYMLRLGFFWLAAALAASAQILPNPSFTVTQFAGTGSNDGLPALSVALDGPNGVAEDNQGNIYIAETNAGVIWRVLSDGTLQRFAGTGRVADGAPGSPALATDLLAPSLLLWDGNGGLYFVDNTTCKIRHIGADTIVQEIAGTGTCATATRGGFGGGGSGGNGPLDTALYQIGGMALDSQGNLLFSEPNNQVVRQIDQSGSLNIIAGAALSGGFSGDTGLATAAQLNSPTGLATDNSGNLYISDYNNCRIRIIDPTGNINTFMGARNCAAANATYTGNAGSPIEHPLALAFDNSTNALIVALPNVYRVIRYDLNTLRVSTLLGNGKLGTAAPATPSTTSVNYPSAILATPDQGVFIADGSFQVYQVQNGAVQIFAGQWPVAVSATTSPTSLQLLRPSGLFPAADGSVLLTETGSNRLLRFNNDGTVAQIGGVRYPAGFDTPDSGPATSTTLDAPLRVAQDANGNIFVLDSAKLRVVTPDGNIKTLYSTLNTPAGMVLDSQGRVVISEAGQSRVIRIDPMFPSFYTLLAGTSGKFGFSNDGSTASGALLNSPGDLAYDASGNLLIADRGNHRIRSVTPGGIITTIAGSGLPFSYADIRGQSSLNTGFGSLAGLAVDSSGNIYVSESDRIDMITPGGTVQVVTGLVFQADSGSNNYLDGPLSGVNSLAVGPTGLIYASVGNQGRVLVIQPH